MIQIIDEPNNLTITSYPTAYVVESDEYIEQEGTVPYIIFQKIAALLDGWGFDFPFDTWKDYNMMEAMYDSQHAVALKPYGTIDEHIINFDNNIKLNAEYEITKVGSDKIKFQYKDVKPFGLSPALITEWSNGAYTLDEQYIGVDKIINPLKIYAVLFVQSNITVGSYDKYELIFDVNENGKADVYFQKIIKSYFQNNPPSISLTTPDYYNSIIKKYYFKFGEYFTDENYFGKFIETDKKYMLNSNLSVIENGIDDFVMYILTSKKFLSNMPSIQKTSYDTKQYLYYIQLWGDMDLYIRYIVYYTDLTSETKDEDFRGARQYGIINIPVDYNIIKNIVINPSDKEIYKYSVQVYAASNDGLLAGEQMYVLEKKNAFQEDFLFQNEFAVYETLMAQGNIENEKMFDNEIFKQDIKYNFNIEDGIFINNQGNSFNKYTAFTGYKTKEYIENIAKLLKSNVFYFIDYQNNRYIPCKLLSSSVEVSDTQNNIFSLQFTYRFAFDS